MPKQDDATRLLTQAARGEAQADERFTSLLYRQLHDLARGRMRAERRDHTLQPTDLVHEVYLRLSDQSSLERRDRGYFLGVAAREMRRVLVDHARARNAAKRSGRRERILLEEVELPNEDGGLELMDLESALKKLAAYDERLARIVELRFFAGLTVPDVAAVLGLAPRTVEKDWRLARARLYRYLKDDDT
jgi:RNA polymerase sigma factor (TIGR02999 family)